MFDVRIKIPDAGNPYYNKKPTGYNPCILGNNDHGQRVKGLNVLPNCVSYATGRFAEIIGEPRCEYLGDTNACNYIALARKQGLKISKAPTLGGVMVWTGGSGGYGHVACVEATIGDNVVVTSESEYYGKPFVVYTRKRHDGNWRDGCYWQDKSYKYAGCIMNPAVMGGKMTYEDFCKFMKQWLAEDGAYVFETFMKGYLEELAAKPADKWAEPAIDYCRENGLMVGDASGNFRPQSPVKREELAAVLSGLR